MKSWIIFAFVLLTSCAVGFAADDKKSEKKKAEPVNKKCPVEGGDIDPKLTTEYKGKTIGFCCDGCPQAFKKEPAKYMAIVEKEIAKDKEADKSKDSKKTDDKAKDKEKKELKHNAKCPVTGDEVDKSISYDHKDRKVTFCCEDCMKDFKKDPKKYAAKLEEMDKAEKKEAEKKDKEKEKEKEKDKKSEK